MVSNSIVKSKLGTLMEVYTRAIPAPSMEAEGEGCEFQGSLSYIASLCVNSQGLQTFINS